MGLRFCRDPDKPGPPVSAELDPCNLHGSSFNVDIMSRIYEEIKGDRAFSEIIYVFCREPDKPGPPVRGLPGDSLGADAPEDRFLGCRPPPRKSFQNRAKASDFSSFGPNLAQRHF